MNDYSLIDNKSAPDVRGERWFDLLEQLKLDEGSTLPFNRLTTDQVEVLEAELLNQGRLPQYSETALLITRHLSCDAALWRWKQRRFGLSIESFKVHVALPAYVLRLRTLYSLDVPIGMHPEREPVDHAGPCHHIKIVSTPERALEYLQAFACFLVTCRAGFRPRMQLASDLLIKYIVGKPPEDQANVLIPESVGQ